jgi:hypothetical protein
MNCRLAAPRQRNPECPRWHAEDGGLPSIGSHPDILGIGTFGSQLVTDDAVLREGPLLNARMAASAARSAAVTGAKPTAELLFSTPIAAEKPADRLARDAGVD